MYTSIDSLAQAPNFQNQNQNQNQNYDIRFSGTYEGIATAKVRVSFSSEGKQTVEFLQIDASKPIYVGGLTTPTDPSPDPNPLPDLPTTPTVNKEVIAQLYELVAEMEAINTPELLKLTTDSLFTQLLPNTEDPEAWSQWKEKTDQYIASLGLSSLDEYKKTWLAIAKVLSK